MTLLGELTEILGVWEEAQPYVTLMYDEQEMRLLVAMRGRTVTIEQAAELLRLRLEETNMLLQQAYGRHIIDRSQHSGTTVYSPAAFDSRLDHFATYDKQWDDIPAEDRRAIDRRFLDQFIAKHRTNIERKVQSLHTAQSLHKAQSLSLIHI